MDQKQKFESGEGGNREWMMFGEPDGYSLAPEVRRKFVRPPIDYPNGMVPVEVIQDCFPEGFNLNLSGAQAVPMAQLHVLLDEAYAEFQAACAGCPDRQCDGCKRDGVAAGQIAIA